MKNIVEELRTKKSRDNRELLDRAADRIEELENECATHGKTVRKIFDDIERLLYGNQIETHTGLYYREELKDSFDILKRVYIEREG